MYIIRMSSRWPKLEIRGAKTRAAVYILSRITIRCTDPGIMDGSSSLGQLRDLNTSEMRESPSKDGTRNPLGLYVDARTSHDW